MVAGNKINMQKSGVFLYTDSVTFKIASKTNKKTLTKKVKDLHVENYKTLIKETEADSKKEKESPCFWMGRINTVKMTILTQSNLQN